MASRLDLAMREAEAEQNGRERGRTGEQREGEEEDKIREEG